MKWQSTNKLEHY